MQVSNFPTPTPQSCHSWKIEKYSRLYPDSGGAPNAATGWVFLADKPMKVEIVESGSAAATLHVSVAAGNPVTLELQDLSAPGQRVSGLTVLQKGLVIYARYQAQNNTMRRFQLKFATDEERSSFTIVLSRFIAVRPLTKPATSYNSHNGTLGTPPSAQSQRKPMLPNIEGLRLPTPVSPHTPGSGVCPAITTDRRATSFDCSQSSCMADMSCQPASEKPIKMLFHSSQSVSNAFLTDSPAASQTPASITQPPDNAMTQDSFAFGGQGQQSSCSSNESSLQKPVDPIVSPTSNQPALPHIVPSTSSEEPSCEAANGTLEKISGNRNSIVLDFLTDAGLCTLLRRVMKGPEFRSLLSRTDFDSLQKEMAIYYNVLERKKA
ncbi:hypothetical protein DFJ77DRAFT_444583 [Powellomyces hirtus]|nr:hypothetical protein DFJ77DRAFT_444583 [Powellomyces hirtus]